ncbi:MAG: DUF547 domain-containing protein [Acidobacteriota bacterium]
MRTKTIIMAAILLVAVAVAGVYYLHRSRLTPPAPAGDGGISTLEYSLSDYAALLSAHVGGDGLVDYRGLKLNREPLDRFVVGLGRLGLATYQSWDESDQIAFWINAYNALTILAVVDHYPVAPEDSSGSALHSIREIPGVWDRLPFTVLGQRLTLDQIEHETLRKHFTEPRIHVALVCAARSCPPLRNEPYEGDKLEEQLDDQARRFLSSRWGLDIDPEAKRVRLSSIFQWYGEDFVSVYESEEVTSGRTPAERSVLNFVSGYLDPPRRQYLLKAQYLVEYLDYDWSLNEPKTEPLVSQMDFRVRSAQSK